MYISAFPASCYLHGAYMVPTPHSLFDAESPRIILRESESNLLAHPHFFEETIYSWNLHFSYKFLYTIVYSSQIQYLQNESTGFTQSACKLSKPHSKFSNRSQQTDGYNGFIYISEMGY